jgi:hypothetical protein
MAKNHKNDEPRLGQRQLGTFTNSIGRAFPIEGMSPMIPEKIRTSLRQEWENEGRPILDEPKPPTYQVTNAAGEVATFPHDEQSLVTDEDRATWAAYLGALEAHKFLMTDFESEVNRRLFRAVCLCVKIDPDAEDEWAEEQAAIGIEIPEKRAERRLSFVETEVIRGAEDIIALMTAVFRQSGMADERTAAAAEAAFRAQLDAKNGQPDDQAAAGEDQA